MSVYYNEIDPYAAQWLRNLIKAGHIAAGDVDERSIEDVKPCEIKHYTQHHFFAGIGVWSYALRQAGWPDDKPVITGSCPCQPFSTAGKGRGFDDERHLWPAFYHIIEQLESATVFGEQVASKDTDAWIDLVQTDLERLGYAFGCVPFPSAGIGAPHIRDRNYWVGHAVGKRLERFTRNDSPTEWQRQNRSTAKASGLGRLADNKFEQRSSSATSRNVTSGRNKKPATIARFCSTCGLGYTDFPTSVSSGSSRGKQSIHDQNNAICHCEQPNETNGYWSAADWLGCRDGKWRPIQPGTFPLANGVTNRMGKVRAYGNAINAEAAKAFIESFLESI